MLDEEYALWDIKFDTAREEDIVRLEEEINNSDYVLIPSDFIEQSFIKQNFPKEKLIKIPFGVDLKKFSPKKNKPDNKFRAVFVGSVQVRKGIQYILKSWSELKLKNAELIIVGRVWPDGHSIVEKYKTDPTIKFVGFEDPRGYYQQSDICVFASIEEGSALATYEAMASGLPLITTFNSGSVVRDGKDGFIIPIRDVSALKNKISYFYNNRAEIKKMGKNARKHMEQFSWEKYGEKLINVYDSILKSKDKLNKKVL